MKNVLKDLLFIIIFLILFHFTTNIFVLKGNSYGSDIISFYNLKKNSLDLIFFGSSHSYTTFNPEIIYEDTNLKSYNFSTQQQPIYISYYYMIESLKTQKPKYFVLDIHMFSIDDEYLSEGTIRDAIDKLKFSKNKINAIKTSVKDKNDYISYYLNIIKYHSRYNKLTLNDFKTGILYKGIDNNGFIGLDSNDNIFIDNTELNDYKKIKNISNKNKEYLEKIVNLAEDNNIKLILVKTPCKLTKENKEKYNYIENFSKENNIDFIDYNILYNELNLTNGDYFDDGHLSNKGATKVSHHFANYLIH